MCAKITHLLIPRRLQCLERRQIATVFDPSLRWSILSLTTHFNQSLQSLKCNLVTCSQRIVHFLRTAQVKIKGVFDLLRLWYSEYCAEWALCASWRKPRLSCQPFNRSPDSWQLHSSFTADPSTHCMWWCDGLFYAFVMKETYFRKLTEKLITKRKGHAISSPILEEL